MTTDEISTTDHDSLDTQHNNSPKDELPVQHKPKRAMLIAAGIGLVVGIGIGIGLKTLSSTTMINTPQVQSSPQITASESRMISEFPIYEIASDDPAVISVNYDAPNKKRPSHYYHDIAENAQLIDISCDTIMAEIHSKPITRLDYESAMANPEKTQKTILEALQNNPGKKNSEDFIISINGNLNQLQNVLNSIDYKKLYLLMKNKPKGNETIKMAVWREMSVDKSKVPNADADYLCVNDQFYEGNSVLDPSLLLMANQDHNKLDHFDSWLIWGSSNHKNVRYYPGFVIDEPIYIWIDDKQFRRTPVEDNPNGTIQLAKHIGNDNRELTETILRGNKMDMIYGRLIPNGNNWYFVLSYRQFSLYDMRNRCHAIDNYGSTMELPF